MLHAQKRRAELKVEMDEQSALIAERKGHYRTHSDALLAHLREELRAIEANDMEPRYATPIKALILRAQRDREHVLGEA
ncbi:MAG TPA: hypothetical protein PKE12_05790 [Kiritimatiellia bacterium]|nr:hypothetical protein [Kiritimatiellia bacterium]